MYRDCESQVRKELAIVMGGFLLCIGVIFLTFKLFPNHEDLRTECQGNPIEKCHEWQERENYYVAIADNYALLVKERHGRHFIATTAEQAKEEGWSDAEIAAGAAIGFDLLTGLSLLSK